MGPSALELIAPYCDLRERLSAVPASAMVRGLAFQSIVAALRTHGKLERYETTYGALRYASMSLYPLGDYLVRLASAGAELSTRERLFDGVAAISRTNAHEFTRSILGQALIRDLAHDPLALLEQGVAMRRQTCLYGHWELTRLGPREAEMRYAGEPVWIEQAVVPAAEGTFEACSVQPEIHTKLTTPYDGATHFRW